jgi:hypothetical protein
MAARDMPVAKHRHSMSWNLTVFPRRTGSTTAAIADPSGIVHRIAEYLGLPVTAAAASFIAPELRRHRQERPIDTPHNEVQGLTTLTT